MLKNLSLHSPFAKLEAKKCQRHGEQARQWWTSISLHSESNETAIFGKATSLLVWYLLVNLPANWQMRLWGVAVQSDPTQDNDGQASCSHQRAMRQKCWENQNHYWCVSCLSVSLLLTNVFLLGRAAGGRDSDVALIHIKWHVLLPIWIPIEPASTHTDSYWFMEWPI